MLIIKYLTLQTVKVKRMFGITISIFFNPSITNILSITFSTYFYLFALHCDFFNNDCLIPYFQDFFIKICHILIGLLFMLACNGKAFVQWRISEHKTVKPALKPNWKSELECKHVIQHDAKRVLAVRAYFYCIVIHLVLKCF
jgi:hypothetical protein